MDYLALYSLIALHVFLLIWGWVLTGWAIEMQRLPKFVRIFIMVVGLTMGTWAIYWLMK